VKGRSRNAPEGGVRDSGLAVVSPRAGSPVPFAVDGLIHRASFVVALAGARGTDPLSEGSQCLGQREPFALNAVAALPFSKRRVRS